MENNDKKRILRKVYRVGVSMTQFDASGQEMCEAAVGPTFHLSAPLTIIFVPVRFRTVLPIWTPKRPFRTSFSYPCTRKSHAKQNDVFGRQQNPFG